MNKRETNNTEFILKTENLTVGYDMPVVKDINVSVKAGEIAVLIGPNGVGKTTFIKTVCGIIPTIDGKIFIEDKPLSHIKLNDRAKMIASVLTEKTFAEYTCEEMVAMGRYPYTNGIGSLNSDDVTVVESAMEMTGTIDIRNRNFLKISDGQKQRVLLARAICQEPKLLVLDEPTSFLDVKYKMEFLRLLKKLSSEMGFAVVMSLHELDMARQIADTVICMKDDHVDKVGRVDEIFSDGYIKELFKIENGDFDESTGLGILWHTK